MRSIASVALFPLACALVLAATACTTSPAVDTPGNEPGVAGPVTITGTVASIDTQPWAYDGNAVVQVDAADGGRVAVELPARWNLCEAPPVDVEALAVGMQVQVVGDASGEGGLVVCSHPSHRLAPVQ